MPKIVTIIGARPQFIKAAIVSYAFAEYESIKEVIVHTGQHFDNNMSDVFFSEMGIPKPSYFLDINGVSHGAMTGRMIERIEEVLIIEKPDYVLVYGDTNSTLAGALAAKKLHLNVVHVEAGLRSYNMRMPEEINRILTDRISDILFCPTDLAVQNLKNEGYEHFPVKIIQCGDVMEDAALHFAALAKDKSSILEHLKISNKQFLLCTIHRAENTDEIERLSGIIHAINELSESYEIIIPLHPRTQKTIKHGNLQIRGTVIPPVGYLDMLSLLNNCKMVLTDSGGIQKEAYFFDKFCITLRDETEWKELVDHGYNFIVGADSDKIIDHVRKLEHSVFHKHHYFYGNGMASKRIADKLAKKLY